MRAPTARAWPAALLALLALSCSAASEGRRRVQEAVEREGEGLSTVAVSSADGRISLDVEARAEPWIEAVGPSGDLYSLEVPIASDSQVHCLIFPGGYHLGTLIKKLLEEEPGPGAKERKLLAFDAGALGGRAFVFVSFGGLVSGGEGDALFMVKAAGVSLGFSSFLCVHDDVGFEQTFRRVVEGIATSIRVRDGAPSQDPEYHEIYVTKTGPVAAGFLEARYYAVDDAAWISVSRSTLILPVSTDGVRAWDSIGIRKSDAAGRIVGEIAGAVGGEGVDYELELGGAEQGAYRVVGVAGRAEVDETFRPSGGLADHRALLHAIAVDLVAGGRAETRLATWLPAVDPRQATELGLRRVVAAPTRETEVEIVGGPVPVLMRLDRDGLPQRMTFVHESGAEIEQQRIFTRGTLPPLGETVGAAAEEPGK